MATAAERGFAFKDIPTVIDPAAEAVEIKVVPYRPADGGDAIGEPRFAHYRKLIIPQEYLPFTKSLDLANIYGDADDFREAGKAFAYGADGVLNAVLYRDGTPHRGWTMERIPEEFTGRHNRLASVRFMFEDLGAARRVADLAGRLQVAIRLGRHYDGMQDDAQELINLVVGGGLEPRLVEVADPPGRVQFEDTPAAGR